MVPLYAPREAMRERVALVVPAWFAPDTPPSLAEQLLLTTLIGIRDCFAAEHVIVVADGSPVAARAAQGVAGQLAGEGAGAFQVLALEENRGKGGALVAGIRALLGPGDALASPDAAWVMVRDADGDHMLDDAAHLYRAGEAVLRACPGVPACVIGARAAPHFPLGWIRGELELLLNEVLVEAVAWALARTGAAWDTRFLQGRWPDLQSGYKLYSREAALLLADALEEEERRHPWARLMRTGMEIVPFVTIALAGGVLAEVGRKSYQEQPVTSYGAVDLAAFYGDKLAWSLLRCGTPPRTAGVLLDGAIVSRPAYTDPGARAVLLELRRRVLGRLVGAPATALPPVECLPLL
jgi:hypothetical protein